MVMGAQQSVEGCLFNECECVCISNASTAENLHIIALLDY